MKNSRLQRTREPNRYTRRFLTIAIIHLVAFIVCVAPLAVFIVVNLTIHIDPAIFTELNPICVFFLMGNPLVDSIGFLVVYRRKLRGRRPRSFVGLRVIQTTVRSVVGLKEINAQDDPVAISNDVCDGIAVVNNKAT